MVKFKKGDEVVLIKEIIPQLTYRDWRGIGEVSFDKIKNHSKLIITRIGTGIEINNGYYYPKKCFRLKNHENIYELW